VTSMAEQKRQLVANELARAALLLLAGRGFDAVTIDDIVAAAGVSRRTYFRYFSSKEDVVVQFLAGAGADVVAALVARPPAEPPSVALRHAVWVPIAVCADHPDQALLVTRLILDSPALQARYLERQIRWRTDLTVALATRLRLDPTTDPYPAMAAGMTVTAFNTVLEYWREGDDHDRLATLADRCFAIIAPALDASGPPAA
jgi:AcrR family transcriptional regulator